MGWDDENVFHTSGSNRLIWSWFCICGNDFHCKILLPTIILKRWVDDRQCGSCCFLPLKLQYELVYLWLVRLWKLGGEDGVVVVTHNIKKRYCKWCHYPFWLLIIPPSPFMPFVKLRLHPKRSWPLAAKMSIYVCRQRSLPLSFGLHVSGIKLAAWNNRSRHIIFSPPIFPLFFFGSTCALHLLFFLAQHKACTWSVMLINSYSYTHKPSIEHGIVHGLTFHPSRYYIQHWVGRRIRETWGRRFTLDFYSTVGNRGMCMSKYKMLNHDTMHAWYNGSEAIYLIFPCPLLLPYSLLAIM